MKTDQTSRSHAVIERARRALENAGRMPDERLAGGPLLVQDLLVIASEAGVRAYELLAD